MKVMLMAVLMSFSLGAAAQATTDEPPKKPEAKKVAPKKVPAKKVVTKKVTPPAKPVAGKVYTNDPRAPILRDKDGNVIPTNPNAYDVSSAVGKK